MSKPFEQWEQSLTHPQTPEDCWSAALEWAAGQAGAAGCICGALQDEHFRGKWSAYRIGERGSLQDVVEIHDPRCPVALAAKIREGAP